MRTGRPQARWRTLESLFDGGALGGLTDGELLDCFINNPDSRGHEAFRALVERHGPMVPGVCRGLLNDTHDVVD